MSKTEEISREETRTVTRQRIYKRLPRYMKWFIKGPVAVEHVNVEGSEEWEAGHKVWAAGASLSRMVT